MPVLDVTPVEVTPVEVTPVVIPVAEGSVVAAGAPRLRRLLVGLDTAAAAVGWTAASLLTGGLRFHGPAKAAAEAGVVTLLTLGTVLAITTQRLYLARICSVRAVEIARLWRASIITSVGALLLPRLLPVVLESETVLAGFGFTFILLLTMRGIYRHWLAAGRRNGRFLRQVVVVGTNDEGANLCRLIRDHPEAGCRLAGVVGDPDSLEAGIGAPLLGSYDDALKAVRSAGACGVLIAASGLSTARLNLLLRSLLRAGVHVQLSSGVRGIDHRRLRPQPFAHEPLFYIEPLRLASWQLAVKRGIDLTITALGGVLVLPVIVAAAIVVKLQDGGPAFYRQQRIGRNGTPFTIIKLRTMVPEADRLYNDLAQTLRGRDGPLIKLASDPRRTRVGRILERTSIDELPQLLNVLRGEMSLVGPRPAQASEVANFDEELLLRLRVLPGITGLWQVEARDNPRFSAYRRYDLFYLENWSVSLDVAILVSTFQRVALRSLELLVRHGSPEMPCAMPVSEMAHESSAPVASS